MVDVDSVIMNCVDDIWGEYDTDGNGSLDREECRRFIMQTIKEFAGETAIENFSHEDFEFTFRLFDTDRNGTIDKSEMVRFIRKVAGLPVGKLPKILEYSENEKGDQRN